MEKIVLICNDSNSVFNFRRELILCLLRKTLSVVVISSDNKRKQEIESLGAKHYCVEYNNRSKNIFESYSLVRKFFRVLKLENPDYVITFQLKPNIFGTRAAKKAKIKNIFSMVEGLGDPFQPKTFKDKIIRAYISALYRNSLCFSKKVFVLNNDDYNELINRRIIEKNKTLIVHGIGIDTSEYKPLNQLPKDKKILMLSRLIKNKGIYEFCEIARQVKKVRPDVHFELYGEEQQLNKNDLSEYIKDGTIFYGGFCSNPVDLINSCRILMSCSHREGFSRVILEGMALAKPIVASNCIGNKDEIIDNVSGFLLPVGDIKSFSSKILEIIDDDELLSKIGNNARNICVENYDSKKINEQILNVILNK